MEVLKLIRSQIRCLERFKEASSCFLAAADAGDFGGLDQFERNRASLLKGFDLFDRKITESVAQMGPGDRTPALLAEAEELLFTKSSLIQEIMGIDDRIIERISTEQLRISTEISRTQRSNSLMKRFKSGWVPESGEQLDEIL
ncbi:MAG: hypothetical protein A2X94_08120 [Bdellovibrionales bacterium GWB1_55_8]|nr:MAG: hypothetical protein A2X94_08120 [Bdellovibrionales bacterium GWB1_55_8]